METPECPFRNLILVSFWVAFNRVALPGMICRGRQRAGDVPPRPRGTQPEGGAVVTGDRASGIRVAGGLGRLGWRVSSYPLFTEEGPHDQRAELNWVSVKQGVPTPKGKSGGPGPHS